MRRVEPDVGQRAGRLVAGPSGAPGAHAMTGTADAGDPAGSITVRVPCSTSNLGSGFDTVGLALDRYLAATWRASETLSVQRRGTLADLDASDADDLFLASFRRAWAGPAPRGELVVESEIPVGRGLGSSAAARVAGTVLGRAAGEGAGPGGGLDAAEREAVFLAVAAAEGHGDNAAPAVFGGLCAAVPVPPGAAAGAAVLRAVPLRLSRDVGFAWAAPAATVPTAAARRALPSHVPHAVAVAGLGRISALLEGLATADPDLLRAGLTDALHVPWRAPLIPGAHEAMSAAREAGAWGVTISGAGSGLIALGPPDLTGVVAGAMREAFARVAPDDGEALGWTLVPDLQGVEVGR